MHGEGVGQGLEVWMLWSGLWRPQPTGQMQPFDGDLHSSHSAWDSMRTGIFPMQGLREMVVGTITGDLTELLIATGYVWRLQSMSIAKNRSLDAPKCLENSVSLAERSLRSEDLKSFWSGPEMKEAVEKMKLLQQRVYFLQNPYATGNCSREKE